MSNFKPIEINGYDIDRTTLDALYDKSIEVYMSEYENISNDYLALPDTRRPKKLKPTDEYFKTQEWDINAGVQERTMPKEFFKQTGGYIQNYSRMMRRIEEYSKDEVPAEVVEAMEAGEFGPLENFIAEYTKQAGKSQAISKTKKFWNIFNYGTYSAGHAIFNQSLPSGKKADDSGDKIYDSKPLFVKSGGSEHPQSNLVTGTTYYNYTVSLAWSRANYETVRTHLRNTNNKDLFGREFFNLPTHIFANDAMERYIEPDMRSAVTDGDNQTNIRQNELVRFYSPFISDTDAWGVGDPKKMILWVENWKPIKIRVWLNEDNDVWHIRVSNFYGYMIKDWHPFYWCNQAES